MNFIAACMFPLIFILPCMNKVLGFSDPSKRPAASASVSVKVASAVPSLPFFTDPEPFLRSTVHTVGLVSLHFSLVLPLLLENLEVVDAAHLLDELWALLLQHGRKVLEQLVYLHDVIKIKILRYGSRLIGDPSIIPKIP